MSNHHGQQLADYIQQADTGARGFARYLVILDWLRERERRAPGSVEELTRAESWAEIERMAGRGDVLAPDKQATFTQSFNGRA